ncbi:DUF2378 family protein [Melittangium boletus]|uniref:TIGR02265 family protein n=1 Tax=Melittangium boletus DSM 14713 TaxID=1294270 RepID=A0A250IFG6_9BACT|nr:DUF2378 family protein [Melittangium boletus]ATB30559.1 hypothetical protein MEBOL_004020 [Melittangium boletus DSM 14713]
MSLQKVVFATAVEALFVRELGANLTGVGRRLLREVGLDLDQPLEVSYPLEQWKRFVSTAATVLYPHLPSSEAHWWMGIHFVEGYLQTSVGRVVADLAPVIGPRRMLERMGADLSSGNNFSEVRLMEHRPRYVELWMNDVLDDHSSFAAGLILRAQQMAGARNVSVDVWSFDGTAGTFLVRWRDAVRG